MGIRHLVADERWFAILLMAAVLLHAATSVARPMASYRALDIGMPPETLGLVATSFAIAPFILALWIGRRIDRDGPFPFLAAAAGLQALSAVLLVFVEDALPLLMCVGLLGLSQLVFAVANQTLVGSRSRLASYDQRFGSLSFVASVGQLIGPVSAGLIASSARPAVASLGPPGVGGTGLALLFGATLSVLSLPVIATAWRRDPGPSIPADDGEQAAGPRSVREVLRMPGMAPAMLASLTVLATMDVLVVYLPALGQERGLPIAVVGALLSARAGASMASRLALASLVGRIGRPRLMVGSLLVASVAVVALAVVPLPLMFVAMVVIGGTLGVMQPMTMSWVAARATADARGMAMSVRLLGNRAGQVVIPLIAGSVAAVTGPAGVIAATGVAVGLTAALVAKRRPER